MNSGRTVFAQLLDFLPKHEFNKCIERYRGHRRLRSFSCLDQFLCMAFAQLTYRDSLRDIETCLRAMSSNLYHAGFRGAISRSTLADANERRDWRIYSDFAHVLIAHARQLYANEPFAVDLDQPAYAFDSTTIDLCLALFPWAKFRRRKGAVKLHTMIDLHGNIPCFIHITDGKTNDVKALDEFVPEPTAFYMMDRGYVDFRRLYRFTENLAYFVIRAKRNLDYARRSHRRVDKSTGLRSDQTIVLRGVKTSLQYPVPLRRISYRDADTGKRFVFLTNNFHLPALTIPQLYKCRWQVEVYQSNCTSSVSCCCVSWTGYDSGVGVAGIGPMDGATRRESIRRILMSDTSRNAVPPRADGRQRRQRRCRRFCQPFICRRNVSGNFTDCSVG